MGIINNNHSVVINYSSNKGINQVLFNCSIDLLVVGGENTADGKPPTLESINRQQFKVHPINQTQKNIILLRKYESLI